jgi:excinuclease UvrABC ATPase subunit
VDGVPPAIAIDQTNPVRTSRSTVGTMTELNDHLKLLFARAAELFDRKTALPVRHDTAQTIYADLLERGTQRDVRLVLTFPVELPANTSAEQVEQWLSASGFTRCRRARDRHRAGPAQAAGCGGRPLPHRQGRQAARDGGHRAGAEARQRADDRLRRG